MYSSRNKESEKRVSITLNITKWTSLFRDMHVKNKKKGAHISGTINCTAGDL